MPLYEYECLKCKTKFERLHSASKTPDDLECPKCKARNPKRLLSLFSSNAGSSGAGSSCGGASRGFS